MSGFNRLHIVAKSLFDGWSDTYLASMSAIQEYSMYTNSQKCPENISSFSRTVILNMNEYLANTTT